MATPAPSDDSRPKMLETLQAENAELFLRLGDAEETTRAIQQGAVDAFVVQELSRYQVYTLEGADRPYRLFVEGMQQGAATLHWDGTIVYCNRRLADLLKVPPERVIGRALQEFIAIEDHAVYGGLLAQGQTGLGRGEARLRQPDGGLLPTHLTFSLLPQDCGGLIGVLITDLTTQKHHEQLLAAQEALREADRRKSEFLAMLAHELRNPLAPIRNAVDILRLTAGDPAAVQSTCAMLERQVGQLVQLVDDLLDVSRISRNRIELHKERIELASVIGQAIESIRPFCSSMGHELVVSMPQESLYLDGDPVRLTQVFANLLDNACKYMDKGGAVRLSAEVSRTEREPIAEVVVRIKDSGIGIAADQLSRIFDMFAQVDTSLERARSGLGIGLTLVKKLVELHDGTVEARSAGVGQGSEFVVRLPVLSEPPPLRREASGVKPAAAVPRRVLVVDDNQDAAECLATLLKLNEHEVHLAHDGLEAIEVAAKVKPEVILLDIGLPRLSGYEAARRIREQQRDRRPVLVAMTGWGQEEDRRRSEEAGFDAHLVKPVDLAALSDLLVGLKAR